MCRDSKVAQTYEERYQLVILLPSEFQIGFLAAVKDRSERRCTIWGDTDDIESQKRLFVESDAVCGE